MNKQNNKGRSWLIGTTELNKGKARSDIFFEAGKSTTGEKGIHFIRSRQNYQVIWKGKYLGTLKTKESAIEVRDQYRESISDI